MIHEDDVHKGLKDAEVRKFLAQEYQILHSGCSQTVDDVQKRISQLEKEMETAKERLEIAKKREAIELIISLKGWGIHESDELVDQVDFPFVGTEREFTQQFQVPELCGDDGFDA